MQHPHISGLSESRSGTVSVGIPCYDRPEGLRRTLDCITGQSYADLEIIVADNASTDTGVREVAMAFMARDPRVRYVRHDTNIGGYRNFRFVLAQATGEFFMWAADDDEWAPEFVGFCVANIGDSGSIMTAFSVLNRTTSVCETVTLPELSGRRANPYDVRLFVRKMLPSMIYGLHRREALGFFLRERSPFDWLDCYVCLRLVWASGFCCRNDVNMYVAGIDANQYAVKAVNGRKLRPLPCLRRSLKYLLRSGSVYTVLLFVKILFAPR
jgi:glycosyltransferase involved in cell wall biosynthesis